MSEVIWAYEDGDYWVKATPWDSKRFAIGAGVHHYGYTVSIPKHLARELAASLLEFAGPEPVEEWVRRTVVLGEQSAKVEILMRDGKAVDARMAQEGE